MSLRPLRAAVQNWQPGRGLPQDPVQAIAAAWPSIVGAHVAGHSAPVAIVGETLVIATPSSAWSQQLQFLSVAILGGVNALPEGRGLVRLSFRSSALRMGVGGGPASFAAPRPPRVPRGPEPEPAVDLWDAFERVRRRVSRVRALGGAACGTCGAQLNAGQSEQCPPCLDRAGAERFVAAQRALYMTPWLGYTETREQVPALVPAEFERARRHLIQRWWLMLERARRARRVSTSGFERQIASSYVLLQSRLPPDRINSAIVRNVLGAELEALVWGTQADSSNTTSR